LLADLTSISKQKKGAFYMNKYLILSFLICNAISINLMQASGLEVDTKVLGLHSEYNVVGVMKRLKKEIKGIVVEKISVPTGEVNFLMPKGTTFYFESVQKAIYNAGFCLSTELTLAGSGTIEKNGTHYVIRMQNSKHDIIVDDTNKDLVTKLDPLAQNKSAVTFKAHLRFHKKQNAFYALDIVSIEAMPANDHHQK
jgi:hypothetical protein